MSSSIRTLVVLATLLLSQAAFAGGQPQTVRFCAVGDVMLDRGVRTAIEKHGVVYPFEHVSEFLSSHDVSFCNLECVLSQRGVRLSKTYTFRGDTSYAQGLRQSGLTVYSLANNHSIDYGREALLDTKRLLEDSGLHVIGAGENQTEASSPKIVEVNGVKLALLGFVTFFSGGIEHSEDLPEPAYAKSDRVVEQIRQASEVADFTIVSFHWGDELSAFPSASQKSLARRAIENGADLVLGHHPHVIQGVEKYGGGYIVYSLGNFVFSSRAQDATDSFAFECAFGQGGIVSASLVPIVIKDCRPDFAHSADYERIVEKIRLRSEPFGVDFEERNGVLWLR